VRILMLDNEFPPLGGGMGTVNLALFRQFAPLENIEIDLVTSALGSAFEEEQFSPRIRIYKTPVWNKNIHHSTNRELIIYTFEALWLSARLMKQRRYDFCFAMSALPAGAAALILMQVYRLPYMVWVSGPDIPGFERRYKNIYPLLVPLIRAVWRSAQPVIAKCNEEVEMIHAIDKKLSIRVIPNGVDSEGYIQADIRANSDRLKVISVARLIERKGQHHIIQAVKRLKDQGIIVQVSFLGAGDSLEELMKLSTGLAVDDCVRFVGYVPREELPRYYAESDLFVLSSFNEGMSLAALEAMAAGLPLLLTRTGGTDMMLIEGNNGFSYEWGDVDRLAALMGKLAKDRDLLKRMGSASRTMVEKFSWSVIAGEFLNLFSTLVSSRAKSWKDI
jgi:phosphatidyl-myo-inositol dimannoside synthase